MINYLYLYDIHVIVFQQIPPPCSTMTRQKRCDAVEIKQTINSSLTKSHNDCTINNSRFLLLLPILLVLWVSSNYHCWRIRMLFCTNSLGHSYGRLLTRKRIITLIVILKLDL